jgi:hypothetical protein
VPTEVASLQGKPTNLFAVHQLKSTFSAQVLMQLVPQKFGIALRVVCTLDYAVQALAVLVLNHKPAWHLDAAVGTDASGLLAVLLDMSVPI